MTAISSQLLAAAVVRVERMSFNERERLADEVHERQPNLLASVVVLQRFGVSLEQMEIVLNVLLVFYSAMKASGVHWPVISEDLQDRCMQRVSARVRFIEGLTPQQQTQAAIEAVTTHPEQQLLAYVFGKFQENGLLGVGSEADKMLTMGALNMVECIAEAAPKTNRSVSSRARRKGQ